MKGELRDQSKEIKELLKKFENKDLTASDEEDKENEVIPYDFCRKISSELNWKMLTGFNIVTLQKIVERASSFILSGRSSSIKNNECIILALVWLRTGTSISSLSIIINFSYPITLRGIQKGLRALSQCFEPFSVYGNAPKLSELLTEEEKKKIPKEALESQFIVDGKHIRGKRLGTFEDAKTYYSFKLNTLCYQFQCVVTHMGHCIHVTNAERAGTHDMMVYRNNRGMLLAGLAAAGFTNPIILGDKGYKVTEFKELYAGWDSNPTLNARRLIVENYFGRMTKVFGVVKEKFSLGYDHVNDYIKALCFLTNVSVKLKPLREKDYRVYRAFMLSLKSQDKKKKEKHAEIMRKSRHTQDIDDLECLNSIFSTTPSSLTYSNPPSSKQSPFYDEKE